MRGAIQGCLGICTATVVAPSLVLTASNSTSIKLNYSSPLTDDEVARANDMHNADLYVSRCSYHQTAYADTDTYLGTSRQV